jgi:lipid-binding SYLF domain-containing protein
MMMMKRFLQAVLSMAMIATLSACWSPSGSTLEQKRAAIDNMQNETLNSLYSQRPEARDIIAKAAGYAVFSNVNAQVVFLGGAGGFGVAVRQPNGERTYMKMAQVDLGLGIGLHDIRVVFVFLSAQAYNNFVNRGWEFGAQADAAAKARDKGAAATGEVSIDAETTMYTMSESGLMAKVNLAGTKYWRDDTLN